MKIYTCAACATVMVAMGVLVPEAIEGQVLLVPNQGSRTIVLPVSLADNVTVSLTRGSAHLDDCDEIEVVKLPREGQAAEARGIEVVLETADGGPVPWWKAIDLYVDGRKSPYNAVAEGNGHTSQPLTIDSEDLLTAQLVLVKPKELGVATGMYQVLGLDGAAGRTLKFTWKRDHC